MRAIERQIDALEARLFERFHHQLVEAVAAADPATADRLSDHLRGYAQPGSLGEIASFEAYRTRVCALVAEVSPETAARLATARLA